MTLAWCICCMTETTLRVSILLNGNRPSKHTLIMGRTLCHFNLDYDLHPLLILEERLTLT